MMLQIVFIIIVTATRIIKHVFLYYIKVQGNPLLKEIIINSILCIN